MEKTMPVYKTAVIQNSNRVVKWFETREEAVNFLNRKIAMDLLDKLNVKGHSREFQAQLLLDSLNEVQDKLALVDSEIQEYVAPS